MSIAIRIRALRDIRDLKQPGLADLVGKSRSDIAAYESGRTLPPIDVLISIATIFGVSLDYLMGRNNKPYEWIENDLSLEMSFKIIKVIDIIKNGDISESDMQSAIRYMNFISSDNNVDKN